MSRQEGWNYSIKDVYLTHAFRSLVALTISSSPSPDTLCPMRNTGFTPLTTHKPLHKFYGVKL
jgi:hypothetical protein